MVLLFHPCVLKLLLTARCVLLCISLNPSSFQPSFWGTMPNGLPRWHHGKESTCQCRKCRFEPWVGKKILEKEMAYPLQYSCLKNSMDRGAWWAIVHGVTKSTTQLNDWTQHMPSDNTFLLWKSSVNSYSSNATVFNFSVSICCLIFGWLLSLTFSPC